MADFSSSKKWPLLNLQSRWFVHEMNWRNKDQLVLNFVLKKFGKCFYDLAARLFSQNKAFAEFVYSLTYAIHRTEKCDEFKLRVEIFTLIKSCGIMYF